MEVTIFLFKFPGSIQGYFSLLTLAMPFTDFTGSSAIQLKTKNFLHLQSYNSVTRLNQLIYPAQSINLPDSIDHLNRVKI